MHMVPHAYSHYPTFPHVAPTTLQTASSHKARTCSCTAPALGRSDSAGRRGPISHSAAPNAANTRAVSVQGGGLGCPHLRHWTPAAASSADGDCFVRKAFRKSPPPPASAGAPAQKELQLVASKIWQRLQRWQRITCVRTAHSCGRVSVFKHRPPGRLEVRRP